MHSLRWIVLLAACVAAQASEEEFLEWQTVSLKCKNEKTPAGPVSCEITQGDAGYASFVIRAFGQDFKLSAKELAQLKDFPLSSLKTSHEAGYANLGGHMVHFRFERRNNAEAKKPVVKILYVSVTKSGVTVKSFDVASGC